MNNTSAGHGMYEARRVHLMYGLKRPTGVPIDISSSRCPERRWISLILGVLYLWMFPTMSSVDMTSKSSQAPFCRGLGEGKKN